MNNIFLDIYSLSLNKKGEELCGDKVLYRKTKKKTTVVLSDGLGSGVKANILSTLTTNILLTMLNNEVSLEEVLKTVIGTLPICNVRKIAYSTFIIIQIDNETNRFTVSNCDSPPILYFRKGKLVKLEERIEQILGKKIIFSEGTVEQGDFIGAVSDGVLYAGMGVEMNFGWGWDNIAKYLSSIFIRHSLTRTIVRDLISKTYNLYHGEIGDDATFVGIYVRQRNPLLIFTGPPLDESQDEECVDRLINFPGRKVVCGGTTAQIVAMYMLESVETDITTMRKDVPPIGLINGVDLVTEGILTIAKTMEYIQKADADITRLKFDNNGAYLLAKEILQADSILFLIGQSINEAHQNPLLPQNISLRRNMIESLVKFLKDRQREVKIEYC